MVRRDDDDLVETSLYNQMSSLRIFIKWSESRDLLEGVFENIIMPNVEDDTRGEKIDPDRGKEILKNLRTYEYASLKQRGIAPLRFESDFADILRNADIVSPEMIHFGNEKSVEYFGSEQAGAIAGISPSSDDIEDWLTLLDKDAYPR